MKEYNKHLIMDLVTVFASITLGFSLCLLIQNAIAHTPCDEDYIPPDCGYELSVNPISGKLEDHYVCR